LEQDTKRNLRDRPSPVDKTIEVSVEIKLLKKGPRESTLQVGLMNRAVQKTVIEWLSLFAPSPGERTNRHGLRRTFDNALSRELESEARPSAPQEFDLILAKVPTAQFDQILDVLEAEKLVRRVAPPRHVETRKMYWQLTPKGIQKLAELRAKRPIPES
jgi:hypothetical protein